MATNGVIKRMADWIREGTEGRFDVRLIQTLCEVQEPDKHNDQAKHVSKANPY